MVIKWFKPIPGKIHRWFAWYPVYMGTDDDYRHQWAWLMFIWRWRGRYGNIRYCFEDHNDKNRVV